MFEARHRALKWTALAVAVSVVLAAPTLAGIPWHAGAVEMSDGETVVGKIYITDDRLIIYNETQKRFYTVRAPQIKTIESLVEKEYMERVWFFKESGSDEKVYTGERYPVRMFNTRITFHDGNHLEGHIIARTFYVDSGGRRRRLILRRKLEGDKGESLDDLVYVRTIILDEGEGGVLGSISGTVRLPEGERLLGMKAIHRQNDFAIAAELSGGGRFRFVHCTKGTYDLVAISNRAIYVYFSREKEEKCSRLHAGVLKEIHVWIKKLRDFFHAQELIYGAGNEDGAYVLVRMERYGRTTLPGTELLRRYEVWHVHKPADEWQIKKRLFIHRERSGDRNDPRERLVIRPALGGHVVDADHSDLTLEFQLGPSDEVPVPAPPAKKPQRDGN